MVIRWIRPMLRSLRLVIVYAWRIWPRRPLAGSGVAFDMRVSLRRVAERDAAASGLDGLLVAGAGPVGRTYERSGHDAGEADLVGLGLELDELLGLDPPLDGVVAHRGAEVLGDGDQLAAGVVQVAQRLADLLAGLAHAEDQVGLGDEAEVAGLGDHVERALVAEGRADPLEDARDGLDVVGQHLG